jgi:hypothetical protein
VKISSGYSFFDSASKTRQKSLRVKNYTYKNLLSLPIASSSVKSSFIVSLLGFILAEGRSRTPRGLFKGGSDSMSGIWVFGSTGILFGDVLGVGFSQADDAIHRLKGVQHSGVFERSSRREVEDNIRAKQSSTGPQTVRISLWTVASV